MKQYIVSSEYTCCPSTLRLVEGTISITTTMRLPADWIRDGMIVQKRKIFAVSASLTVIGCAAGGAVLMNFLAPSGWAAGFGFAAGMITGLAALHAHRVAEVSIGGATLNLQMKLEALARDADDARKLAQLSVEAAFIIANRPTGVVGGGLSGRNDGLRKLIAERLTELGFSKEEGSQFARFDDPHMARRIIQHMILKRVEESTAGGAERVKELVIPLLGAGSPRDPEAIASVLGAELLADTRVREVLEFYKAWHNSTAKLYFVVENLDRLKETANRSFTQIP